VRAWGDALPRRAVTPLSRPTVEALLRSVLGELDSAAMRWVWDTTAGNPLFVRELVTDATERGALFVRDGRWTLAADRGAPGRRLRDVVVDRFGSLWDAERDAVELLAVAAPIGLKMLEKLVSPDVVQELEHRGLITAERSGRRTNVRLAHAIQGEVVRELLGPSTIAAHRRRLLDASSSTGERRRSDRLRTALWRVELGDTSDPAGLLAAAEELAVAAGGLRFEGASASGDTRIATGRQMLERSADLAQAALDAGAGVEAAALAIGVLVRLGRHDDARAVRASMNALAAGETDEVLVARTLADLDAMILGDPHAAATRLAELEVIVTSPDLQRGMRATRAGVLGAAGQMRDALEIARSVLDDADATPAERVRATGAAASALGSLGRSAEAIELLDGVMPLLAGEDPATNVSLVLPRIFVMACGGQLYEVSGLIKLCWSMCEAADLHDGMAIFGASHANAALLRGKPRRALMWAETALDHLGDVDPVGVRRLAHAARAYASALLGDADTAGAAIAVIDTMGSGNAFEKDETRARAWTDVATGRTDHAIERLLARAEVNAERGEMVGAIDHLHDVARLGGAALVADRVAALAAGLDGRIVPLQAAHVAALAAEDADGLERTGMAFAGIGADLDAAEAFGQSAALHRRAGRQGRASAAAARSRELADRCEGATTPALNSAEPLLALTKREREIALLACEGLSNREIADRLVVSVRTVHAHLYNAYAKLGVDSREGLSAVIVPS
jgi:DNA-binding CsgD family transcriptional regulator